ncbi:MAG: hypothetical protein ABFS43_10865 [Thermodesulfobacteriota bacterium]
MSASLRRWMGMEKVTEEIPLANNPTMVIVNTANHSFEIINT